MKLCDYIKEKRLQLGISQGELAQAANVSRNYLSLLERGACGNISARKLAKIVSTLTSNFAEDIADLMFELLED